MACQYHAIHWDNIIVSGGARVYDGEWYIQALWGHHVGQWYRTHITTRDLPDAYLIAESITQTVNKRHSCYEYPPLELLWKDGRSNPLISAEYYG